MTDQLLRSLGDMRERVRASLIAGKPTDALRTAIAQIEQDIERQRAEQQKATDEHAQRRSAEVAAHAAEIASQSQRRISALLARFPLPTE